MTDDNKVLKQLIETVASRIIDSTEELTALDQAIGDGDHGLNMKRGFGEVLSRLGEIAEKPIPEALKAVGMALVMKIGGASGPLYGTLIMALGEALPTRGIDQAAVASALHDALGAVMKRGKSEPGQKTMLDVWVPVHKVLADGAGIPEVRRTAQEAAEATIPMLAIKGRASYLGERSIGHMDPGARSSQLVIEAACDVAEGTP